MRYLFPYHEGRLSAEQVREDAQVLLTGDVQAEQLLNEQQALVLVGPDDQRDLHRVPVLDRIVWLLEQLKSVHHRRTANADQLRSRNAQRALDEAYPLA